MKNKYSALQSANDSDSDAEQSELSKKKLMEKRRDQSQDREFKKMRHVHYVFYILCVILDRLLFLPIWIIDFFFHIRVGAVVILKEYDKWVDERQQFKVIERRRTFTMTADAKAKDDEIIKRIKEKAKPALKKNIDKRSAAKQAKLSEQKGDKKVEIKEESATFMTNARINITAFKLRYTVQYDSKYLELAHTRDKDTKKDIIAVICNEIPDTNTDFKKLELIDELKEIIKYLYDSNTKEVVAQYIQISWSGIDVTLAPIMYSENIRKCLFARSGSKIVSSTAIAGNLSCIASGDQVSIIYRDVDNLYILRIVPVMETFVFNKSARHKITVNFGVLSSAAIPYGAIGTNLVVTPENTKQRLSSLTNHTVSLKVDEVEFGKMKLHIFEVLTKVAYTPEFTQYEDAD